MIPLSGDANADFFNVNELLRNIDFLIIFRKRFQMKLKGFTDVFARFFDGLSCRDASWQAGNIGAPIPFCLFEYHGVASHGFSISAFRKIDFSVPTGGPASTVSILAVELHLVLS